MWSIRRGVAELAADEDFSSLMRRADEALYEAKGAGRDRVRVSAGTTAHGARAISGRD